MATPTEFYCSHCKRSVIPIRGVVNYRCPKCGATILASQVDVCKDSEEKPPIAETDTVPPA